MTKRNPARHTPDEVDTYLNGLPEEPRAALEAVRQIVRETAPGCTERVSYGIPVFRLKRDLIGMSARDTYCSLHVMSPALVKVLADELTGYKVSGATVHFTTDAPLSRPVIERIVRERVKELG